MNPLRELWRLVLWLLPGGDLHDGPVGGARGWLHIEGSGARGWVASWSQAWHEPGQAAQDLAPAEARALGLWDSGNRSTEGRPLDSLTQADIDLAIEKLYPVLYYATDPVLEPGRLIYVKETKLSPELVICRPEDLEALRAGLRQSRRLVHVRDEPRTKALERLKRAQLAPAGPYAGPPEGDRAEGQGGANA